MGSVKKMTQFYNREVVMRRGRKMTQFYKREVEIGRVKKMT